MFDTAVEDANDFANGIRLLAELGCDIFLDDVSNLSMPFFHDGVIGCN